MTSYKNNIIHGSCVDIMREMEAESIDCTITSPPYDDIRYYSDGFVEEFDKSVDDYEGETEEDREKAYKKALSKFKKEKLAEKLKENNGYSFPFEQIADELYRVTKKGGVIVWVVGDAVVKGSESGSSFRQALYFMEKGFKLHDTMLYEKNGSSFPARRDGNRYSQIFEYMFVFSKEEKPKTANLICDKKNKWSGWTTFGKKGTMRAKDGVLVEREQKPVAEFSPRNNIWKYNTGKGFTTTDKFAFEHPAIFPELLVEDHILTWTNEGDTVLDPFVGSGTTPKMAHLNNRKWLGIDISKEYVQISKKRLLVAEELRKLGYERKIVSSSRDTISANGKLSHKECSNLNNKERLELILVMQDELSSTSCSKWKDEIVILRQNIAEREMEKALKKALKEQENNNE